MYYVNNVSNRYTCVPRGFYECIMMPTRSPQHTKYEQSFTHVYMYKSRINNRMSKRQYG